MLYEWPNKAIAIKLIHMKYNNTPLLLILLYVFASCSKSSSGDTVTYEVKITSGTWSGDYFDYSGATQALKMVSNEPNGWKYTFSIANGKKADLVLSAIPDNVNGSTVAITNIYLSDKLIATDSSVFGATAQIIINQ